MESTQASSTLGGTLQLSTPNLDSITIRRVSEEEVSTTFTGLFAEVTHSRGIGAGVVLLTHRPISNNISILALIDVAIIFTGLDGNQAGKAVRRLLEQFPGKGQKTVDVAPMTEALECAFLLPGHAASKVCKKEAKLLVRFMGGDLSLVDDVCKINRV